MGKDIDLSTEEGIERYRHSTSHVMAQAVKRLFPKARLAIGPAIAEGFYYDFDLDEHLTPEHLSKIEKEMEKIIKEDHPFEREEIDREKARTIFSGMGEKYKVDLIEQLSDKTVSLYRDGEFFDLCRGPHIGRTGQIKAFKLLSVAGAYWRGDEKNQMLQRIYGTAWESAKELAEYLSKLEEAKQRDHRRLGRELDLFNMYEEAGAGLVFWHPRGAILKRIIQNYWEDMHLKRGYQLISIPHIAHAQLWQRSGHYQFYRQHMYTLKVEDEEYVLKPMNCPGHILIFKSATRSYRDLPIRFAEMGTVYRYERSGVLHGMLRVRGFTQDDAHIFCTPEQLPGEIEGVLDLVMEILGKFGFKEYEIDLSARDPKKPQDYAGSPEDWDRAEGVLMAALKEKGMSFRRIEGEAVFYGPKIDIKLLDALGRKWQCSTIQFDFNLPGRFDASYIGNDNKKHHVVMVHRALFGSLERFIGTLIEHYKGAFPLWLAPVQAIVIPVSEKYADYAEKVYATLKENGVRVECDRRNEKMGLKIREAQIQKIPYMLVVGEREAAAGTVALRSREEGDKGPQPLDEFIEKVAEEVRAS
ncbi:MAG: threonine--tRNA ligase [Candidatus Aureabacteria bacterium]|nr:threonine--tRNA ligase [Candidatus Auribacterota bacterium]